MSKKEIINRIKSNIQRLPQPYEMPEIPIRGIQYADPVRTFSETTEHVGGKIVDIEPGTDINALVSQLFPEAKTVGSNLPEITISTIHPDRIDTPVQLNQLDVAIVKGHLGIAENACIWIPQEIKERALYFIAEHLVVLLDKDRIVHNMHEAYEQITLNDYGFGVFISGPSKTADIEQALVIGAHGARSLTVVLTSPE